MRRYTNVFAFVVASFAVVSVVIITKCSNGLSWSYFSSYTGTWTTSLGLPSSSPTNPTFPSYIVIFLLCLILHLLLYFHYVAKLYIYI